jgi:hypothetical protein
VDATEPVAARIVAAYWGVRYGRVHSSNARERSWVALMDQHSLVADLAGLIGLVLLTAWPLLRGRRAILLAQSAGAMAFVVHYLLIGALTGAAMVSMSVVQALAALSEERPLWRRLVYLATIPALVAMTAVTWAGLPSLCAALGLALTTAARWQRSVTALRVLFLASAGAWVAHDFLTGSLQGIVADIACGIGLVHALRRDQRSRARMAEA